MQLAFRAVYVKYLEKKNSSYLSPVPIFYKINEAIAQIIDSLKSIRFINVSVWEKWISKKWFPEHIFNQNSMETLLEISANLCNNWSGMALFQRSVYLVSLVSSEYSLFLAPSGNKDKLILNDSFSFKDLMALHHAAPKSNAPGFNFLEF